MGKSSIARWAFALMFVAAHAAAAAAADARLADAVKKQDKAAIHRLLALKVDVNTPQPDGATALHWAAYRDDLETAAQLIKAGAKVDATNDYGVTPLSLASTFARGALVDALLTAGANPNLALPSGETPLMTAARAGRVDAIKALLAHQAAIGATENTKGQTALMWAVSDRRLDAVRTLLEAGATVNAASASGFTPLMFSARAGDVDLTRLLIAKGAKVNDTAKDGVSALHVAVVRGHVDLALFLLAQGADPNADKPGYTPLHWASGKFEGQMTFDYSNGEDGEWAALVGVPAKRKVELVNALLKAGAQPNARLTKNPPRFGTNLWMKNILGATPFLLAAQAADVPVMRALLAGGADPKINTENDATPLMFAASFGRVPGESRVTEEAALDAVHLCLELGMDTKHADSTGDTALHAVAYYGWVKMGQWLLDHGADINAKNKRGETALRVSQGTVVANMLHTEPKITELLVKNGAKTD